MVIENVKNSGQQAIVPQKTMLELSRVIGNGKGVVVMVINDTQISFTFNQTEIISRLVDGQYPEYKNIIPAKFLTIIQTPKAPLMNALRAGGIFSQSTSSIKLDYSEDDQQLVVTSESAELGKSVVQLPSSVGGESGSLLLNYHYMLDCLAVIDGEQVTLKIVDDNSPTLILPEKQEEYLYLVMPIKT